MREVGGQSARKASHDGNSRPESPGLGASRPAASASERGHAERAERSAALTLVEPDWQSAAMAECQDCIGPTTPAAQQLG